MNVALPDAVRLQVSKKKPRRLRSSTRKVCAQLSKAKFVDTMQARRWWDESHIFWSIRWDCSCWSASARPRFRIAMRRACCSRRCVTASAGLHCIWADGG